MKDITQPISSLHQLLDADTGSFTSAEIQLLRCLPSWMQQAGSSKLQQALEKYKVLVQRHIDKLEGFIREEELNALTLCNTVMQAHIADTDQKMRRCADPDVRDACLLAGVQSINHYKISLYGTAAAFAKALGMEKYVAVFREAEVNEKQIDDRLSQLAEHEINLRAKAPVLMVP